jgi:outer membrane murein-binding lipoprotein Lpp
MTPAEVERKVRQLDNDVQSIYELLMGIQSTQTRHTNRLHELGEDVGALSAKVDSLEVKVDSLEVKVDTLGTQMDEVLQLLRAR